MKHIFTAGLLLITAPAHAITLGPLAFVSGGGPEVTGTNIARQDTATGRARATVQNFRVLADVRDRPGDNIAFAHAGVFDLVSFSADTTIRYNLRQRQRVNFGGPDGEVSGLAWVAFADVTGKLAEFTGRDDNNFFDPEFNINSTRFDFRGLRSAVGATGDPGGFFSEGAEPGLHRRNFSARNVVDVVAGHTYAVKLFTWVLGDGGDARSAASLRFRMGDGVTMSRGSEAVPVPLPAGLPLIGVAIAALIGIGRRRKSQPTMC